MCIKLKYANTIKKSYLSQFTPTVITYIKLRHDKIIRKKNQITFQKNLVDKFHKMELTTHLNFLGNISKIIYVPINIFYILCHYKYCSNVP